MNEPVLDRLCPDEKNTPPSARTWAREIRLGCGLIALELRDPNSGQGSDPEEKPRHQYLVARKLIWRRVLRPAPLDEPLDETPYIGDSRPPRWELADISHDSPIFDWAAAKEKNLRRSIPVARTFVVRRNMHGTGYADCAAFLMLPSDPLDKWGDITSYPGAPVNCPVPGCSQHLVWYEAGYVPGYRACMAPLDGDSYDPKSIRHRFAADHRSDEEDTVILLDVE